MLKRGCCSGLFLAPAFLPDIPGRRFTAGTNRDTPPPARLPAACRTRRVRLRALLPRVWACLGANRP